MSAWRAILLGLSALGLTLGIPRPSAAASPPETITVVVTKEGTPVAGMRLRVIGEPPGGGQVTYGEGTTGANGELRVSVPFRPGLVLFAEGKYEGVSYHSEKLPLAGQPGAGLTLPVKVFSTKAASLDDLSFSDESHVFIEIDDGFLDVTEVLTVVNEAKGTFNPESGLELPLPSGFRNVRGVEGQAVFPLEHVGARISGPFLPGETQVQVRFELPFDQATVTFRQPLRLPWPATRLIIDELPGLEIRGPQVEGQELREASGRQLRLVALRPEKDALAFEISGLPIRSENGRWVALAIAIAIALFGVIGAIAPAPSGGEETPGHRRGLEAERDALLADLEELERDRRAGRIDDEVYEEDRQAALDQLAAVLRSLETEGAPATAPEREAA